MLQCEARLLYEANQWALRTMGMVIFSFVPILSRIGQVSANCRRSIGDLKSYVGRHTSRLSIDWVPTAWISIESRLRLADQKSGLKKTIACVASISVRFRSKERPRNGILSFDRARNETRAKKWKWLFYLRYFSRGLWLVFLVLCS